MVVRLFLYVLFLTFSIVNSVNRKDERAKVNSYISSLNINPSVAPFPTWGDQKFVGVKIFAVLTFLIEANAAEQTLSALVTISAGWMDERVEWTPNISSENSAVISANSIWFPHLLAMTAINGENSLTRSSDVTRINIMNIGYCHFQIFRVLTFSCNSQISKFPTDTMTCILAINGAENDVFLDPGYVPGDDLDWNTQENSEWKILDIYINQTRMVKKLAGVDHVVESLTLNIVLQRRPRYYVTMLIVPACVLSLLSIAMPLVPVESGERISFSTSIAFTYFVFLLLLDNILPKSGAAVLSVSILSSFVVSAVNVLESVFICIIAHRYVDTDTVKGISDASWKWPIIVKWTDRAFFVINVCATMTAIIVNLSVSGIQSN